MDRPKSPKWNVVPQPMDKSKLEQLESDVKLEFHSMTERRTFSGPECKICNVPEFVEYVTRGVITPPFCTGI